MRGVIRMKNLLLAGAVCFLVGCGGGSGGSNINGTLSYSDGTAIPKGVVSLNGEAGSFRGKVDESGKFTIEKVLPGTYKVAVTGVMDKEESFDIKYDDSGAPIESDEAPPKSLIKEIYSNPEESGLTVTVPSDSYDIKVDKAE